MTPGLLEEGNTALVVTVTQVGKGYVVKRLQVYDRFLTKFTTLHRITILLFQSPSV